MDTQRTAPSALLLVLLLLGSASCIYANFKTPLSYRSPTPSDVAAQQSGAALLADVQADSRLFNAVGVYQRRCTQVRGRLVR